MEELIMTRLDGPPSMRSGPMRPSAVREAVTAYQAAAWRAPATTRFDSRPANDFVTRAEAVAPREAMVETEPMEPMPTWLVVSLEQTPAEMNRL